MPTPLVSLLTPTYNHAHLIAACIDSALAQTMPDWEMVVVDDGSTDGTPEVVAKYRDPRIVLCRLPHRGPAALASTFNHAVQRARGEFVAELEGDDMIVPDRLERQVDVFRDPEVVLAHGASDILLADGRTIYLEVVHRESLLRPDVLNNRPVGRALEWFTQRNFIWSQTVMMRRRKLVDAGGYRQAPGTYLVDHPTYMEMALGGPFCFMPGAPLAVWRRHEGSMANRLGYGTGDILASIVQDFELRHPDAATAGGTDRTGLRRQDTLA